MTEPLTLKSSQPAPPAHCHVEAPPGCCEFTIKMAEGCPPYLNMGQCQKEHPHSADALLTVAVFVFVAAFNFWAGRKSMGPKNE